MVEVAEEIKVAAPVHQVWSVLADFGGIARWAPNVDHSCLTTVQTEGIGTVRRVQVGRNVLLEQVLAWEPAECITYEIEGLPGAFRSVTTTWQLDGTEDATMVRMKSSVEAGPRPPHKIAARVFGRLLARTSRLMLAGLKSHAEGAPS